MIRLTRSKAGHLLLPLLDFAEAAFDMETKPRIEGREITVFQTSTAEGSQATSKAPMSKGMEMCTADLTVGQDDLWVLFQEARQGLLTLWSRQRYSE